MDGPKESAISHKRKLAAPEEVERFPKDLGGDSRGSLASGLLSARPASVTGLIWRQTEHENRQKISWKLTWIKQLGSGEE